MNLNESAIMRLIRDLKDRLLTVSMTCWKTMVLFHGWQMVPAYKPNQLKQVLKENKRCLLGSKNPQRRVPKDI